MPLRAGHTPSFAGVAAGVFLACVPRPAAQAQLTDGYVFDGGTARERATVRAALAASSFDWGLVRGKVTIHIARGSGCRATKGKISLAPGVLAHGRDAWGIVQHEYAHQLDYFRFDARIRARLDRSLRGKTWWPNGRFRHDEYGSERFASTLSYAYWPSRHNILLRGAHAEATALPPARFRRVVEAVLFPR